MSLINVEENEDSWLSEYSATERLLNTISSSIQQRDSQNSSAEYNKISARIRIQIKQFDNEYTELEKKLGILGRKKIITEAEWERRVRNLEQLSSKKIQLNNRFQNTASSSTRSQLFDEASKRNKLYDDDDDDDEPIINNAPIEQIRSEQKQIIRQQDDSLDNLSKAISRQKQIAIRIGGEVDRQNDILDDIADQMDQTSARVDSTTRGVEDVSRRDSTWSYWAIIVTLFIAIIIVLIL